MSASREVVPPGISTSAPRARLARVAAALGLERNTAPIPILVAPTIGGLVIASYGVLTGVRLGLLVSIALAGLTLLGVRRMRLGRTGNPAATGIAGIWRSLPSPLRRLLLSSGRRRRVCPSSWRA
jgi:hypothetical protein